MTPNNVSNGQAETSKNGNSSGNSFSANQPFFQGPVTPQQLDAIRAQIMAYKLLSSNMAIPVHLQQVLQNNLCNNVASPSPSIKSTVGSNQNAQKVLPPHRWIIPSEMPLGIDPLEAIKERETLINSRIKYRIQELESLPNTVPSAVKLKALIELKSLKLLSKQKKLRQEIIHGATRGMTFETSIDRSAYRKHKRFSLKETRLVERLERQQQQEKDKKEKQTHLSFVHQVLQHGREMQNFHRMGMVRIQRINKSMGQYHQTLEREDIKRREKNAKDRIKALKADDEEAYLRLVDQQKDRRITLLLKQTDEYLEGLTNLVAKQQRKGREEEEEEEEDAVKTDYYNTAHKVKEVIEEQPRILSGGNLKDYQLKGLQWMVSLYNNNLNGILADEMGLGKTIQTISLVSYLIEKKKQNGPFLIVVPLSTMTNWSMEFQKWAPSIVKADYKGNPNQRKVLQQELRRSNFNVLLTTYEYIIKDRTFLARIKWLYMIVDEGHRMKNSQSKLSSVMAQYYHCKYRLILTGTPLQNNLPELWALLNFILPSVFNSGQSFDEWFNTPFANTGEKLELNEEESLLIIRRLHKVLRPFLLRRLKKDVESELPDKVERVVKCRLSALQQSLYESVKKSNTSQEARKAGIRKLNNTIMQLRKICNHPFVFNEVEQRINPKKENNELLFRVSGKFELLRRMLPKFKVRGHKVLMFFQMTQIMTIMEDMLNMLGISYLRLDGSTKAEDRTSLLHKFNDPNSPYMIFLLSTRAGGLGLNLQTADTVIIFDSDWNPHQDLQAQDRAHRIGQTQEVRIFRLVTVDSVEEMILARAQFKLNLDGKVIQAGKFDHKSTNEEREAMLRAILETERDANDNDDVYDDDELNQIIARGDEELELFRRMDKERTEMDMIHWKKTTDNKIKSNLIESWELPQVAIEEASVAEFDWDKRRKRKEIVYDDGLTEEQWVNKLEEEPNRKRMKKTKEYKLPRLNATVDVLFQRINKAILSAQDDTGRLRCDLFIELPSRELYPDYYVIIAQPISLEMIENRVMDNYYETVEDLKNDYQLIFNNAMVFNAPGSFVYEDAQVLLDIALGYINGDLIDDDGNANDINGGNNYSNHANANDNYENNNANDNDDEYGFNDDSDDD